MASRSSSAIAPESDECSSGGLCRVCQREIEQGICSPRAEPVAEPEDGAGRHHRLLSRGSRRNARTALSRRVRNLTGQSLDSGTRCYRQS